MLSCSCEEDQKYFAFVHTRLPWTGEWPGETECREFGWYAKIVKGQQGWVTCDKDDPDATEDLNRLHTDAIWSKDAGRFLLPGSTHVIGE